MFEFSRRKPGERSGRLFVLVLVAAGLIKLWLVAGTEIEAWPRDGHDDGLYVTLAQNILNGTWLGDYTHRTLIKVPFFPVFIALCHIVSVPLPVAQELLYIGSCLLMLLALRPAFTSRLSLLVIYLPLLFCPITLGLHRVRREMLYTSLLMAMVACAFALLLRCRERLRTVLWWAVGLGLSVALLWNTREESVAVLPFLAFVSLLIAIGNMGRASWCDARRAVFQLGRLSWIPILLFTCVNLLVCSLNYAKYGMFATCEMRTRSFALAYGTLCGIDSDKKVRYVPVSLADLEKAYAVSPAAKELKPFLDGPLTGWKKPGSELVAAEYANEYKGGWIKWAFRDAVDSAGHCKSWHDANDYYNRFYLELKDAFETGKLKGTGPRSSCEIPVMSLERDWKPVTKSVLKGLGFLMSFSIVDCAPPRIIEEVGGLDAAGVELFEQITGSRAVNPNGRMTGWAFCGGNPAGLEIVRPDGRVRNTEITRAPRPDLVQSLKGALTQDGQYGFSTGYIRGDKLRVLGSDGRTLALLEPISGRNFGLVENAPAGACIDTAIENQTKLLGFKYSVHRRIAGCYKMTIPWFECVSLVAIALTLPLFWRKSVLWLYALVIAAVAAFLPRLVALAILDASTAPYVVNNQGYLAPGFPPLLLALALPVAFVISNWRDIATRWHSTVARHG